jgi:hypothetical protein
MRYFVTTIALLAVLGPVAARAEAPSAAQITCGALPGVPNRIAYAAPEASACCAQDPACARLLATTVIRRARPDLHT